MALESDDDDYGAFDVTIAIPVVTMRRMIGPVVEVIALAITTMRDCEMHEQPATKVVVVGRSAVSQHLVEQLCSALHQVNAAISVVVPSIPGSAVLTGKVLYVVAPKIVASHKLQRMYSFDQAVPITNPRFQGADTSE
ncbi:hypothetical protein BC828DRAFT_403947 [Blastocladiella britannica]|nr:hypothetical protein BC828DRAFT_403947 [Blastocladiella britannica]